MRLIIRLMHHIIIIFFDDLLATADFLCLFYSNMINIHLFGTVIVYSLA